ncbi:hypothetical protein LTR20_007862 [Exophiala xenobiotica]|nr:hypothetical protein LTR93_007477 [Exophiala xenobiotica]KAK5382060.1 hypothetical protein LTS13_002723 [Exophiala xenobiotica]KAK5394534.1 hypothetical protein LTR79_007985 [Exophiala xenobiotica]KAK5423673.1 hypothetical protein LTR90_001018 [Exophiala xenobiotica]KAK5459191.1 hypothetical protein LTR20_007862 [Exophiala xenobiotica]
MGTPSSTALCALLGTQSTQQLLYHYRCLIASKLAWIDSVDSPWRSIILPMAMESPSLLFSILSMAAGDLSSKLSNASIPNDISTKSNIYRELAIKHLATELADYVTTTSINSLTPKGATITLAATLVLCNLEVKLPHSTLWPIHLRAARAVIHCCAINDHLSNATSDTHSFLLQKFCSMNAFASMSTFDDLEEASSDNLRHQHNNNNNNVFLEVLQIMQEVTRDQRRQMVNYHDVEPSVMDSCQEVRDKLSQARRKTTVLCREAIMTDSENTTSDLATIADMFYYAGLIYSHQLLALQCCPNQLGGWGSIILDKLDSLREVGSFCQNLLWPLFVAATETPWDEERQTLLERRIQQIVELSGHWNGLRVLDFLRNFWKLRRVGRVNWIDLARDWAQRGESFIVI